MGLGLLGDVRLALAVLWLRDAAVVIARRSRRRLTRSADDRTRATLFPLDGQTDALGQVAVDPAIGALAARGLTPRCSRAPTVLLTTAAVYVRARPTAGAS